MNDIPLVFLNTETNGLRSPSIWLNWQLNGWSGGSRRTSRFAVCQSMKIVFSLKIDKVKATEAAGQLFGHFNLSWTL